MKLLFISFSFFRCLEYEKEEEELELKVRSNSMQNLCTLPSNERVIIFRVA